LFFALPMPRPPRSTLIPYTTLFRSVPRLPGHVRSGSCCARPSANHAPDHFPIVERKPRRTDVLHALMAFSRYQHQILRLGGLDREPYRLPTVTLYRDVPAVAAGQDVGDDRNTILVARVVVGHDHAIRPAFRGLPHQRPFAPIALAAATEHDP